jgi:hypothetical protein
VRSVGDELLTERDEFVDVVHDTIDAESSIERDGGT